MSSARILVPVSTSKTLRNTVAHAIDRCLEDATDGATVHFVYPVSERVTYDVETAETEQGRELLDRVRIWAEEDLGEDAE